MSLKFTKYCYFVYVFKIESKVIDLSEKDKPKKVRITSTIPIVCQDGSTSCVVIVELGQVEQNTTPCTTDPDTYVDTCTLRYTPGPAGQTREIEVVAKRDFVDDGDQTMFLKINVGDNMDPVDFNCYKSITTVKVSTY